MHLRLVLAAALLWGAAPVAEARLPENAANALRAAGIPQEAVGALVVRMRDGATLLDHEGSRPRQPASTLKVLTAIVALDTLGPAHRSRTEILATGPIANGALDGDLVLRGLGNVDFDWRAFERVLQQVRQRGVTEIRGDLVVDLSYFQPRRTDVGTPAFDEAPEFRYNVIPDALLLNTNLLHLDILSDGSRIRVETNPPLDRVEVVADEMRLIDRRCEDWEDGWTLPEVESRSRGVLRVRLKGDFPRDCIAATSINVIDRIAFTERMFRPMWKRLGGTFRGRVREGEAPAGARLLVEHRSRVLADVVRDINKRSDNPITRVVFLNLGAGEAASEEPTARKADALVRTWLQTRGIDATGIVLENGSGLSRHERISPAQLVAILRASMASEWAPEFVSSLPIAALDGGLRRRLKDSPAALRARVKTGTLRDATAVAGYVKDLAGESYIVVAMVDHPLAKREAARPVVDAIVDWAARGAPSLPSVDPAKGPEGTRP